MDQPASREGQDQTFPALEEFLVRTRLGGRTSWLDKAAEAALEALSAASIDAILLKGIALSRLLYEADEHRAYFDVDMLVASADLSRAGRVLEGLGYQNISALEGVVDVAGVLHAQVWKRLEPRFGNVFIDLHWRLAGCEAPSDVVWEKLAASRLMIEVGRSRLPTLDLPGLALHVALHAAQGGPDDLKALGDLRRALDRWPLNVWQQATLLARELRATDVYSAGLRLVPQGVLLADDDLGLPAAEALLWEITHRDQRPRGTFHLGAFRQAKGLRERATILRYALIPSRVWIRRQYGWAKQGRLRLLAAYLVHMLRSPVWATRAWSYRHRVKGLSDPRA